VGTPLVGGLKIPTWLIIVDRIADYEIEIARVTLDERYRLRVD